MPVDIDSLEFMPYRLKEQEDKLNEHLAKVDDKLTKILSGLSEITLTIAIDKLRLTNLETKVNECNNLHDRKIEKLDSQISDLTRKQDDLRVTLAEKFGPSIIISSVMAAITILIQHFMGK